MEVVGVILFVVVWIAVARGADRQRARARRRPGHRPSARQTRRPAPAPDTSRRTSMRERAWLEDNKDPANLPDMPASRELRGRAFVIDGDTIVIRGTKIRLSGIDAPELDRPWGQRAKWAMVAICKGQEVRARLTGERSFDRLVGTCYLPDGRDIGAELIKQGLAVDFPLFSQGKYRHLETPQARQRFRR